jgi:hypothetical protein
LSSRRTSPLVFDRTQNKQAFQCDRRWRPQLRDQPQDIGEQNSGDGDHLDGTGSVTGLCTVRAGKDKRAVLA